MSSGPWLQDTSFCDHFPSAAPSVRWTEGAARHFSTASNLNQWSILVTALLRRRDESSWILATIISDFDEVLSGY